MTIWPLRTDLTCVIIKITIQHDMTWHDTTWHDMTRHDMTWHDMTWHDMTRHDMTWHDTTRHDDYKYIWQKQYQESVLINNTYKIWHFIMFFRDNMISRSLYFYQKCWVTSCVNYACRRFLSSCIQCIFFFYIFTYQMWLQLVTHCVFSCRRGYCWPCK